MIIIPGRPERAAISLYESENPLQHCDELGGGRYSLGRLAVDRIIRRLLDIKGDATQQTVDLLLFLGYFSVCLYGGGVAYAAAYNDFFHLDIKSTAAELSTAALFVTHVLARGWYWLASAAFVLVFTLVYYVCRYVFRPWFGFFLLSFVFYSTFVACGIAGQSRGTIDAMSDADKTNTSKPVVKLLGQKLGENAYASGGYHLLAENEKRFFVFEPHGVFGSVIQVHAVLKDNVESYEVTVK